MENNKGWREKIIYRHFDLPASFPVIGLLGSSWQGIKMPLENMHFHNCLEIGFVYGGSGRCHIGDATVPFKAPCLVIIPPNVPHIHEIDEGEVCDWKWVYTDPLQMFARVNQRLVHETNIYQDKVPPEDSVLSKESYPQLYALLEMIIEEMENRHENYQLVTKELFQAFFLTLLRDAPKVENGSHCACDYVAVNNGRGTALDISSETPFCFNVSPYTQEELAEKGHSFELVESDWTVLCIDAAQSGVGSNSCGPRLRDEYRLSDEQINFEFTLQPSEM